MIFYVTDILYSPCDAASVAFTFVNVLYALEKNIP